MDQLPLRFVVLHHLCLGRHLVLPLLVRHLLVLA
jgi:hypothetical protein